MTFSGFVIVAICCFFLGVLVSIAGFENGGKAIAMAPWSIILWAAAIKILWP